MWAGMPRSFAARARAAAWFPDECVATPRLAVSSSSEKTALAAPRALNAPTFWKFSHLKNNDAPLAASSSALVSTGVRWICGRIRSCARRMASRSSILARRAIFGAQKISDGHAICHRFQLGDKGSKAFRKYGAAPGQVKLNARGRHIMVEELAPTRPQLRIKQTVDVMVMNRFERFHELMGRMEKARLIF